MSHPVYPCVWFDRQAAEAAAFYCSIFRNSKITLQNPVVTHFELDGVKLIGLNGGPAYRPNPSISMFVTGETGEEVRAFWNKFSEDGNVLMKLDKYTWSELYGWCADRYGLAWQVYQGRMSDVSQKVVPLLMFANKQYGHAEEAVKFYTSLFRNSKIQGIMHYGPGDPDTEGKVMHAQFHLNGGVFMAMDGPGSHDFDFNEAVSLVVECDTQKEIDYYWDAFTKDGEESMCGWCKDKFGVSWQVIPSALGTLMSDPVRAPRVTQAFLKMKKFDLETLINA